MSGDPSLRVSSDPDWCRRSPPKKILLYGLLYDPDDPVLTLSCGFLPARTKIAPLLYCITEYCIHRPPGPFLREGSFRPGSREAHRLMTRLSCPPAGRGRKRRGLGRIALSPKTHHITSYHPPRRRPGEISYGGEAGADRQTQRLRLRLRPRPLET